MTSIKVIRKDPDRFGVAIVVGEIKDFPRDHTGKAAVEFELPVDDNDPESLRSKTITLKVCRLHWNRIGGRHEYALDATGVDLGILKKIGGFRKL